MDNSIKKVNIKQKNSILKKITSTKINFNNANNITFDYMYYCSIYKSV